jgi:hypothetical protein
MTDRALTNAEKRRDELAAEINKTNQRIEQLRKDLSATESFIADWHRFAEGQLFETLRTQENSSYPQAAFTQPTKDVADEIVKNQFVGAPRKNPDRATVGRMVKQIIEEVQRPVTREDLYMALAARGTVIQGKDPQMVLSTMLWRMQNEFVRLPKHGYWLRDLPWQPANYEPTPVDLENQSEEEFDLMKQNVLDPGAMADVEPDDGLLDENGLPAAMVQYKHYFLRPQRSGAGWSVHIEAMNSSEPTATTMTFSTVNAAIEEGKKIADSGGVRLVHRRYE